MKRQTMCVTDVCLVGFKKTTVKEKEDVNTRIERLIQCLCWPVWMSHSSFMKTQTRFIFNQLLQLSKGVKCS